MKITIAGYGYVGRGHEELLQTNHNVEIYDPYLDYNNFSSDTDAVVICVATPQSDDGSCYMNNVYDVISKTDSKTPILIKSTISLEGWRHIKVVFPNHLITFSPEFLRQINWKNDILYPNEILLGGDSVYFWTEIFSSHYGHNTPIIEKSVEALILAKYFRNSFLATKVAFFNQVYDLCLATDTVYEEVVGAITSDSRIGESHTIVSAERGFGGHCFPKDTLALLATSKLHGATMTILESAVVYNNKIRK
jgi:UDPglucose 6-dehydrogenase